MSSFGTWVFLTWKPLSESFPPVQWFSVLATHSSYLGSLKDTNAWVPSTDCELTSLCVARMLGLFWSPRCSISSQSWESLLQLQSSSNVPQRVTCKLTDYTAYQAYPTNFIQWVWDGVVSQSNHLPPGIFIIKEVEEAEEMTHGSTESKEVHYCRLLPISAQWMQTGDALRCHLGGRAGREGEDSTELVQSEAAGFGSRDIGWTLAGRRSHLLYQYRQCHG